MTSDTLTKGQRWKQRHPERAAVIMRKSKVKKKFDMSWDDYLAMESVKGSVCWICGTDDPGRGRKSMCVDHCHSTGVVRGLLCFDCNEAIGRFDDDVELLLKAIEYLEASSS
jgi:hypothetical protein